MRPRDALRALAIGRIALGVALVLFPRRVAAGWIGPGAGAPGVPVLARALGIRDAIFGGMLLHTIDHPQVGRRWVSTCAVVDSVDAAAALAVREELPRIRGALGVGLAGGSAVAHGVLARGLGGEAPGA